MQNYLDDTIAAISTTVGESGIGIVRLSGPRALEIADKIFVSPSGKKPSGCKTYTLHYGWVMDHPKKEIVDEVILTIMRSPRSFTREDVVEINCHGGIVSTRAVLELAMACGARLAQPGEFTKRAFLNGRIDLAQAEAVLDIIKAKTDAALRSGAGQLKGRLSAQINKIRDKLLGIVSLIEAHIDFPDDMPLGIDTVKLNNNLRNSKADLALLIEDSKRGRVLREGLHVVICGRPNVGKSSLLNAILKQERSIVTPVAGTTRDTIEEIIDIKGIPIRIVDTAGILEPRDLVEKKAVSRSKQHIKEADLVILVFDGSLPLVKDDKLLIRKLKNKKVIAVINKIDLKKRIKREDLVKLFANIVELSAKKSRNISALEDAIVNLVYGTKFIQPEECIVTNLRHIGLLKKAEKKIADAINSLDERLSVEFIAQDIKEALGFIDDILGKRFSEQILDKIFADFCIGK